MPSKSKRTASKSGLLNLLYPLLPALSQQIFLPLRGIVHGCPRRLPLHHPKRALGRRASAPPQRSGALRHKHACRQALPITMIDSMTEEELFLPHKRKWADEATKTAVWEVYKFIHVNTVAPFGTFRTKIRKWKKLLL